MTSNHDLKCPMPLNEMTRWFFTESRLRESNPLHRFETEVLDALDHVDAEIDSAERRRIRTLVLERTDQIFESDLSWGQNIYSRENLRWVSFIAGYTLVVRENLEEAQPFLLSLEERIQTFSRIRFFSLWLLTAWTIIILRKVLPNKSYIRRIRLAALLRLTYLPFTTPANWTYGHDSFYERFFNAHSCHEMCEVLAKTCHHWKKLARYGI